MRKGIAGILLASALAVVFAAPSRAGTKPLSLRLDSLDGLEAVNAKPDIAEHLGRRAVHIVASTADPTQDPSVESLVILRETDFQDGTIDVDLAGRPRAGAPADVRGFIGIAFRVQSKGAKFECFYLRMTNGRADDQLRRNHAAQYESMPEYPWFRLRKENPGAYESYVDLEPGAWTKMKIVVTGTKALLYVNGSGQPVLVVADLKLGNTNGPVALWVGTDTDAYFSNLSLK
jgi:Domain of Unknown Function (DUF1080)